MYRLLKLLRVAARNKLLLKPKGRRACRAVAEYLRRQGFVPRSVEVWMGYVAPDGLRCLIFFRTDTELAQLRAARHPRKVTALFQEELVRLRYPPDAIAHIHVSLHSDEAIERQGGHYSYFK